LRSEVVFAVRAKEKLRLNVDDTKALCLDWGSFDKLLVGYSNGR
jgi:hypothetical protein